MMILLLTLLLASTDESAKPADALLRPAPGISATQISGRVVDRDGKPVAKAVVTHQGKVLARTDAKGRFAVTPNAAILELTVEAPSYATRTVPVPKPPAVAVGDVLLLRSSSVVVDVSKIKGVREISLVRYDERRDDERAVTKRVSGKRVTFSGLEQGDFLLVARGSQPLQQKAIVVNVAEAATQHVELTIDRVPLRGYVYLGREPLADAEVQIDGPANVWNGVIRTDAEGHYEAELWQVGPLQALIASPKLATEFATGNRANEVLEKGSLDWDIVIPDRQVYGRVVDAETGEPVAHAAVSLEAADVDIHARINVRTDEKGEFRYDAARTGRYKLDVDTQEYMKPATLEFELGDGDPSRRVEVRLERGRDVLVRVKRDDGKPIPGAVVADGLVSDGTRPVGRYRASTSGVATLRGRPGEEKTLYVIPADGSFAIAKVTLDDKALAEGIDVVVPQAESALIIRTKDEEGAALENIRFIVRYNGEMLPPAIMTLLRHVQHIDYRTSPAGEARIVGLPSGMYELWAYRTPREAERLIDNPEGYEPALEVAVIRGTYEADLTFGR